MAFTRIIRTKKNTEIVFLCFWLNSWCLSSNRRATWNSCRFECDCQLIWNSMFSVSCTVVNESKEKIVLVSVGHQKLTNNLIIEMTQPNFCIHADGIGKYWKCSNSICLLWLCINIIQATSAETKRASENVQVFFFLFVPFVVVNMTLSEQQICSTKYMISARL